MLPPALQEKEVKKSVDWAGYFSLSSRQPSRGHESPREKGAIRNKEKSFLEHGIEHQFSSPYTPHQNGVVERKNRTDPCGDG
jgi:transposase InsO family protein